VIRGERIYLRGVERDDLERCHAWMSDPRLRSTLAQRYPMSLVREADWIERATRGQDPSEMTFAICLAESGRHIGNCGLEAIDRDNRNATLGILIGEADCRGQGLGEDAVRTLCRFAFDELDLHKICLEVYAFNEGPMRTYERVGFRREGLLREDAYRAGRRVDVVVMGLLRGELTEPRAAGRRPDPASRRPVSPRDRPRPGKR
jgi:RimJ/RimL family protein N-acetyltransferase